MATAAAPRVYKNFINGEWVDSRSGNAYENRNPADTDELIGMFVSSTAEDVDLAVDAPISRTKSGAGPAAEKEFRRLGAGDQAPLFCTRDWQHRQPIDVLSGGGYEHADEFVGVGGIAIFVGVAAARIHHSR